ncbi:MAG: UvrB/UvrC motif-containing protein, partial [Saprospiraceae bacterium]
DADKEGFLRSDRSLTQTAGRAARNANGLVIFYADRITDSMRRTIEETDRRRSKQIAYNKEHGITPRTLMKSREEIMSKSSILDTRGNHSKAYVEKEEYNLAADPVMNYMTRDQLDKMLIQAEKNMRNAAKDLDFISAAQFRDEMNAIKKKMQGV